ncbi:hypothetical protein ACWGNA_26590 [Brucella cytisi]|uniref:hypothetical protein n=1 Tax=Brucella cytisi TaxID=407152 RepID=UPI0035E32D42
MTATRRDTSLRYRSIFGLVAAMSVAVFGATEFVDGAARLFGFPSLVLGGQTAKAALHQFDSPFENQINAGVIQVSLEKTTISEIQNSFGGEIQSHTAMGKGTTWLCYDLDVGGLKRRIWFVSDGQKKSDDDLVNFVSTEVVEDHIQGCDVPRVDLTELSLPVPTLKDRPDALKKRFGVGIKQGLIRYSNEQTAKTGEVIVQSLVYRVRGGEIDAVAFSQATAHR